MENVLLGIRTQVDQDKSRIRQIPVEFSLEIW